MHTVDELMSTSVKTAHVNDVVGPLRDLMRDEQIHAVPVLDDARKLVGIITSTDLVEEWQPQMGVRTVMSTDVLTAGVHTSIVDAARMMVDSRVHHLVIVERGAVTGVLSSFDVMRHLAGRVEQLTAGPTPGVGLQAKVGDVLVVRPQHLGAKERRATVVEVRGEDGTAPFIVRWADDQHDQPHLTMFFPSSDTYVEPAAPR